MTERRADILAQAAGNMFEAEKPISPVVGPRGGVKHYELGGQTVSRFIRDALIRQGLLDPQGRVTDRGLLVLQDWLADRARV